jgi:hypothetical protein
MRKWATLLVLACVSQGLAAEDKKNPPDGWKEVAGGYKKKAYAVWMPTDGKTDDSEDSIVSPKFGQIRIFRTVCERKDGSLLAAGQILLPPDLTKAPIKVRQDFFRDLFLDEFKAKLIEEKKASLGTMAGKEYVVETPKGMARFRLLGTGVQMYRVLIVGTKEQVQSKEADAFFESFKRTPAAETKDK